MRKTSVSIAPWSMAACLLLVAGCGKEGKPERGLRYMPDMYDAPFLESQDSFVRPLDGGQVIEIPVVQEPVPGTVARGGAALPTWASDSEEAKALVNPLAPTVEVLRLGRKKFDISCAVCHGKDGDMNKGQVAAKLTGVLSINTEVVSKYPDGQIYSIITHGRNRMPSYGAQLLPEERWAVIHYLRALYAATTGDKEQQKLWRELQEHDRRFRPEPELIPEDVRRTWPSHAGHSSGQEAHP